MAMTPKQIKRVKNRNSKSFTYLVLGFLLLIIMVGIGGVFARMGNTEPIKMMLPLIGIIGAGTLITGIIYVDTSHQIVNANV